MAAIAAHCGRHVLSSGRFYSIKHDKLLAASLLATDVIRAAAKGIFQRTRARRPSESLCDKELLIVTVSLLVNCR